MTTRTGSSVRRSAVVLAVLAVVSLGACEPLLHVPPEAAPAPAGAELTVSSSALARGGSVEVTASGCDDVFQYVEVKLVSGTDHSRESTAVVAASSGEPATVTVPTWMPSGGGQIEASCLEPNLSRASDGADIHVFEYEPVPISVAPYPEREPSAIYVPEVVTDGILRISGSDCDGRVMVSLSRGAWGVASRANFHYGSALVQAGPDGTWSAEIPLRYSVGAYSEEIGPGTMTAFAVCEGVYYPPATFQVVGSAPSIVIVDPTAAVLLLTDCPPENTLGVIGLVELADGTHTFVAHNQSGPGYGETGVYVPVPADAVAVTWFAGCHGRYEPSFAYRSTTWVE
jgi:hypothetical protein